ncbi:hypothetical protein [Nostoc sp. 'Lobaria pulmonaria (5183) cyanobiont']|uniref:hypothetical protein n=1 Tax=Nostoc sp. 'Lobaria pulmonaria (5183) cyanobiont' TaxID=1618022 RepID=UPI001319FE33|nr:hypothetical protein [Nostoc sp. 'Lobaria pulmonaria (5183) cyanobiont']
MTILEFRSHQRHAKSATLILVKQRGLLPKGDAQGVSEVRASGGFPHERLLNQITLKEISRRLLSYLSPVKE